MRDLPLILLIGAVVVLYLAILLLAAERGWLPLYATAEEGRAVRERAPWDVERCRSSITAKLQSQKIH